MSGSGGILNLLLFLPRQSSTFAHRVDQLHYFVIITTMVSSAVIGLTAVYFIVRYRRRPGDTTTPHIASPLWLESLIIGGPLTLFLIWFGIGFADFVWLRSPPKDALDVYVTAKKWMWKFSYPDGPSGIGVLTVPAGRPVRLLLTSRDVIHSFYVPDFRIKQDVLPGRYTETWFEATEPGRHQVLCAEYCGTQHSEMRAEVVVLAPEAYDDWLAGQNQALADRADMGGSGGSGRTPTLAEQGRQAAVANGCLKCHSVDGSNHLGPTWRDLYLRRQALEDGRSVIADEAYLTRSMMDPMADIAAGFPKIMPTFQGQLSAPDAAAIVEYIKSLSSRPAPAPRPEAPAP